MTSKLSIRANSALNLACLLAILLVMLTVAGAVAEHPQRFTRVGFSDLRDNTTTVHVIRDGETGQCRAYVVMIRVHEDYPATRTLALSDTWPVACSRLDVPSVPVPPPASAIK